MTTTNMRTAHVISVVRHGESLKNIQDRHGGAGKPLTLKGKKEVKNLVKIISNIEVKPKMIYCSKIPQVLETVDVLSNSIKAKIVLDDRVRPLNLGILSGLSREEALSKYPDPAKQMERWRQDEIEICELHIPQAEDLVTFWKRGLSFLSSIRHQRGLHIIIGTRSILTLLISILLNRKIRPGGRYKYIEIPTGGLLTFSLQNNSYRILEEMSNLDLGQLK